jgi:hypothetical protein
MTNNVKRASEYTWRVFRHFQQKNMTLLRCTITTILAMCTLGSTLLLFTSCSTPNGIVNPIAATWKIVPSVNPGSAQNSLNEVAATSINDAWAVGTFSMSHVALQGSKALIEHWNGSVWNVVKSPDTPLGDGILTGVAAISTSNAWAVGYAFSDSSNEQHTLIEHWNGTSWAIVQSPNPANGDQLFALTALSANNIWAVGTYGNNLGRTIMTRTLIEHWNGTAWSVVQSPNPGGGENYLTGIAAISPNDVWTVGFSSRGQAVLGTPEAMIEHWNGTSWTAVQNVNLGVNGNMLSAITAISPNDVWAVGSSNNDASVAETLIEHWNGTAWSTIESLSPGKESNTLSAIMAFSPHNVWSVGSSNNVLTNQQAQPLIEHWDGTSWSTVISPNIGTNDTMLNGVALVPHSAKMWAVGLGATFGVPVSTPSPNTTTQPANGTPVTAQTLIESCCS